MAKWFFSAGDNSGKQQRFIVTASSKQQAIQKGMDKARKNADGSITGWDCKLKQV